MLALCGEARLEQVQPVAEDKRLGRRLVTADKACEGTVNRDFGRQKLFRHIRLKKQFYYIFCCSLFLAGIPVHQHSAG